MCIESENALVNWPIETIPSGASLFYRVAKGWLKPGETVHPSIFKENNGSMSTDWGKYSDASKTLNRATNPNSYRVVKLNADYIREYTNLQVAHSPSMEHNNRAHTDVLGLITRDGEKLGQDDIAENRLKLFSMYESWSFVA